MNPIIQKNLFTLKNSLLSFIDENDKNALLEVAQVVYVEKGSKIPRSEAPIELIIVLTGEASIRMRTGIEVGRLKAGRSFELRSLILREKQWMYDWYAEESSEILKLPWQAFEASLAKKEQNYHYLGRISQSVAIQRLKRDMAALGVQRDTIIEVIAKLHLESAENLFADWNRKVFCTIFQGEIKCLLDYAPRPIQLGNIQAGDSALFDLKGGSFYYEASNDLRAWTLYENEWRSLDSKIDFESFLEVYGGLRTHNFQELKDDESSDTQSSYQLNDDKSMTHTSFRGHSGVFQKLKKWFWLRKFSNYFISYKDDSFACRAVVIAVARMQGRKISMESFHEFGDSQFLTSSLKVLKSFIKKLGLTYESFGVNVLKNKFDYLPIILDTQIGLLLVLKISDGSILTLDPVSGQLKWMYVAQLKSILNNDQAIYVNTHKIEKKLHNPKIPFFKILLELLKGKKNLTLFVSAGLLGYFADLSIPVLNQYLFDVVVDQGQSGPFTPVIGALLALTIISNRLEIFKRKLSVDMSMGLGLKLRSLYQNKILKMNMEDIKTLGPSSGLTRSMDLEMVGSFYVDRLLTSLLSLVLIVGALSVLWLYHPLLAILALAFSPIEFLIVGYLKNKIEKIQLEAHLLRSQENKMMVEHFASQEDVRALKANLSASWRAKKLANEGSLNIRKSGFILSAFEALSFFFSELARIVCFVVAIRFYLSGEMSLGQVLGTTLLVGRVSGPISSVIGAYFNYFSIRPILSKLAEVIEASEDGIKDFSPTVTNELKGDIQFHDVNYRYKTNSDVPTLKNLNFHISAGQKIAIIGRSGSGKSTLAALMNGLLRPRIGEVLIDNLSLSSIETKRIRNQISLVEQEGRLFSGTVTANIALGEEKPDIERVQWSASLAEIEEDILSKPGGFGSMLMYGGVGLSEGQKQRLLVARAIYKNPSILVLDEATSHLDPISEERLMDKVMREFENKTVIFCTQRVHLALRADRVFFLENGQLMEMGSHYELVKKKGRYYNFYVAHLSLG